MSFRAKQVYPSFYCSNDTQCASLDDLKSAYGTYKRSASVINSRLLINLSINSLQFANALFLTYYDVNKIEMSFLNLWLNNSSVIWITKKDLIERFSVKFQSFIEKYFCSPSIYLDDYFQFVCMFLYFDNRYIIYLLLSMSGIFSNLFIFKDQMLNFFKTFSFNPALYYKLESSIAVNHPLQSPNHPVSIKAFTSFCSTDILYNSHVSGFRTELLNFVTTISRYENVKKTMFIHYNGIKVPEEKLCNKLFRRIFTHKPAPYHHNYGNVKPKDDDFLELINKIKIRYGYSSRKKLSPISCSSESTM